MELADKPPTNKAASGLSTHMDIERERTTLTLVMARATKLAEQGSAAAGLILLNIGLQRALRERSATPDQTDADTGVQEWENSIQRFRERYRLK